jgi:hypothetical protein
MNTTCTYPSLRNEVNMYNFCDFQGCDEKLDPFIGPSPAWSAFRLSDYGYTRMKIHNATHLDLDQFSVDKGPVSVESLSPGLLEWRLFFNQI